jgi:hypothetical protein
MQLPWAVTQELIARIVAAHRETGRWIIASSYGVPALFGKKYFCATYSTRRCGWSETADSKTQSRCSAG